MTHTEPENRVMCELFVRTDNWDNCELFVTLLCNSVWSNWDNTTPPIALTDTCCFMDKYHFSNLLLSSKMHLLAQDSKCRGLPLNMVLFLSHEETIHFAMGLRGVRHILHTHVRYLLYSILCCILWWTYYACQKCTDLGQRFFRAHRVGDPLGICMKMCGYVLVKWDISSCPQWCLQAGTSVSNMILHSIDRYGWCTMHHPTYSTVHDAKIIPRLTLLYLYTGKRDWEITLSSKHQIWLSDAK